MKRLTTFVALAFALSVGVSEAAKPATKGAGKPTVKTQTPKTSSPQGPAAKGATKTASGKAATGTSVKAAKTDTKATGAAAKAAKADSSLAKAEKQTKKTNSTASNTSSTTSGVLPSTTPDAVDFTATKLGQHLEKNSVQRSKIEAKLLAAGYTGTVYEAAYGFKNFGQLNAATNQVQNQGISFELLKVMMTGTYVDPETQQVYRATKLADGTVKLVSPELATDPVAPLSLGQSKQAITDGAVMPTIDLVDPTSTTTSTASTSR